MKSYELLQKDLEAEQTKRRDAVKRAAKAEADLVVMSEACRQSAAHIRRVKADAVRTQREADRLAAELKLMREALDDMRAKLDASKAQHMDAQASVATLTDHLAQERRQHDATKRSAQTAIDAVTEAAEAAATKSADKLRKMTDGRDELIAKVDGVARKRDEWREKMLLAKSVHADELKAVRAELTAARVELTAAHADLKKQIKRADKAEADAEAAKNRPPVEVEKRVEVVKRVEVPIEVEKRVEIPVPCDCPVDAIRSEAEAAKRAENDMRGKLKEANKRLAAYGGAEVE